MAHAHDRSSRPLGTETLFAMTLTSASSQFGHTRDLGTETAGGFGATSSRPRMSLMGREFQFARGGSSQWPAPRPADDRSSDCLPMKVKLRGAADIHLR